MAKLGLESTIKLKSGYRDPTAGIWSELFRPLTQRTAILTWRDSCGKREQDATCPLAVVNCLLNPIA
jgi:hypothetical protein